MEELVHFHHSDDRFCGSTGKFRCFALDPNEVTCPRCMSRDTFVLSEGGQKFLDEIDRGDR